MNRDGTDVEPAPGQLNPQWLSAIGYATGHHINLADDYWLDDDASSVQANCGLLRRDFRGNGGYQGIPILCRRRPALTVGGGAAIENPQAMADVRADPSLIDAAIDESLRRDTPARCGYRLTKEDIELENVTIPAGSQVFFSFGAANHDPELYPEPAKYDIHRANLKRHLGFGHGVHYCVGSHLARAETRIAFEHLLNRISDFRIPEDKPPDPIICLALHGYRRVDLTFTKAS